MDDQMKETLSLRLAYDFASLHGLERQANEIRNMVIEWDASYTSSLRRGYIVALFENHGLLEQFKDEFWPFGKTEGGAAKQRRYLRIKAQYEAFLGGRGADPTGGEETSPTEHHEFALEAHLRDFLARNLDRIEPGLRIYESPDHSGIEYPVEGGRIDLLAVDRNGKYAVIELKLSRGRNKTLGQLLYYMGWVDKHLGNAPCRGWIIVSEITDDLSIAVSRANGITLAKYRMSFAIEAVS